MPKLRRPHVASPDEVKITRNGDTAVFEYADPRVATTHFTLEAGKLAKMNDADLLAYWNEHIAATDEFIRTQKRATLTEILAPNGFQREIRGGPGFRISSSQKGTGELVCRGAARFIITRRPMPRHTSSPVPYQRISQ